MDWLIATRDQAAFSHCGNLGWGALERRWCPHGWVERCPASAGGALLALLLLRKWESPGPARFAGPGRVAWAGRGGGGTLC